MPNSSIASSRIERALQSVAALQDAPGLTIGDRATLRAIRGSLETMSRPHNVEIEPDYRTRQLPTGDREANL